MAEPSYSYRARALSPERRYELQADTLQWSDGGRSGCVAYRDIERLHIFKRRFLGSSATYWSCVLLPRSGRRIELGAGHRLGFRDVEDRTESYIPFIKELEARIAAANPKLRVVAPRTWLSRFETFGGRLLVWLIRLVRQLDLDRTANAAAWLLRKIGPQLRGHRRAAAQVALAFPEKAPAEIEHILSGMWDNLGRMAVEYAHLDRLWDFDLDDPNPMRRIVLDDASIERCRRLRGGRKPALFFGAHIGNWDVSALGAQVYSRDVMVIYKAPRIAAIADELTKLRSSSGAVLQPADATTTHRIRDAIKRGHLVGMLVDEHYADGIEVTMFGRPWRINQLFGRFVRIFDCEVYGFHAVRLPNGRHRFEMTEAIEPQRDADGRVNVAGTMQVIASVIEGWVREHPEQWMWLQRRWRD